MNSKENFIVFGSIPAIQQIKGSKIRIDNGNPILPLSTPEIQQKLPPQQEGKGIKGKK